MFPDLGASRQCNLTCSTKFLYYSVESQLKVLLEVKYQNSQTLQLVMRPKVTMTEEVYSTCSNSGGTRATHSYTSI